jgi:hypothetical protein
MTENLRPTHYNKLNKPMISMKRNACMLSFLFSLLILHGSCSENPSDIEAKTEDSSDFQIAMNGDLTRSPEGEALLDNLDLYFFTQGSNPLSGHGGSWNSEFNNQLVGVTRTGMTLHARDARAGNWDLVMVAGVGATLKSPSPAKASSASLMYTYNPGDIRPDGSRGKAHEIWHRMLRLPEIQEGVSATASGGIARNVAMIRVVVDRAVDIDTTSTNHRIELHGVPDKISWSGTLLRQTTPGNYETSLSNPDTLLQPLTGKVTFTDNSSVETGTYKSDTLFFVIPAHREADFWTDDPIPVPRGNVQDTITHKMRLFVSFDRASGGKFEKAAVIDRVHRSNGILSVHISMKDVNLVLASSVAEWTNQSVHGDIKAPYLNVSDLETTVYDGAASRIYFWSNQPEDSVFVLKAGNGIPDVDAVFDRISGPDAVNRYYNVADQSGYIDIAKLNLVSTQPDVKIYLQAGNLRREITVKSSASTQALKKITTPYVGTFHRGSQVGERLVTWSYTGPWTAYLDDPTGNAVIDRLPSPSFADNTLYETSPSDAEMGILSNTATRITGMNTIYFRVGWKSTIPEGAEPRYATVTVRKGTYEAGGEVIQTLYLRQGEKPSAVYTASRTNPAKFSPYNLTALSLNNAIPVRGGRFTDYPSQSGAYFQWMDRVNKRYAYAASGDVSPWNSTPSLDEVYWTEKDPGLDAEYEVCPEGFRRVSDGSTDDEPTGTSELRQSLWVQPDDGVGSSNTYMGYYADGFFDRHAIVRSITGEGNSAVGTGNQVAYKGRLFYNNSTKASLFFPAAGRRGGLVSSALANGNLTEAGKKGYYWTSSSTVSNETLIGSDAYVSTLLRNFAVSIRCVKAE